MPADLPLTHTAKVRVRIASYLAVQVTFDSFSIVYI